MVPTLPVGSHRQPMRSTADLSLAGHARIVAELIERLGLRDVVVVGNDLAIDQVLAIERPDLVARLVLSSQEAFENYPPGLPGRMAGLVGRLPGGIFGLVQPLRFRGLRRLPIAFGWMSKRPVPHDVADGWFRPAIEHRAIRRDLARYVRSVDKKELVRLAERLPSYRGPALVVWTKEDRVMPPEHGRRLADLLPNARLVEISDSYTLIPEDQPREFARVVRDFIEESAGRGSRPQQAAAD